MSAAADGGFVPAPDSLLGRLTAAVNVASAENVSNTPDFVLATFLRDCLGAFDAATRSRERWYGVRLRPGGGLARRAEAQDLVVAVLQTAATVGVSGVFTEARAREMASELLDGLEALR